MNYGICPHCKGLQQVENGIIKPHSLPVDWFYKFGHLTPDEIEKINAHPKTKKQKIFEAMVFPPNCEGSGKPANQSYSETMIASSGIMRSINPKTFTINSDGAIIEKPTS